MKLAVKQAIVQRFKDGESLDQLESWINLEIRAKRMRNPWPNWPDKVLRDYLNGKFALPIPKGVRR